MLWKSAITCKNKQKESKVYLDMKKAGCFIVIELFCTINNKCRRLWLKLGCDFPPSVLLRDSVQAGQLQSHKLYKVPADLKLNWRKIITTHLNSYLHR